MSGRTGGATAGVEIGVGLDHDLGACYDALFAVDEDRLQALSLVPSLVLRPMTCWSPMLILQHRVVDGNEDRAVE